MSEPTDDAGKRELWDIVEHTVRELREQEALERFARGERPKPHEFFNPPKTAV